MVYVYRCGRQVNLNTMYTFNTFRQWGMSNEEVSNARQWLCFVALFLCTSHSVYTSSRIGFLRYEFFHNTQSHPTQWSLWNCPDHIQWQTLVTFVSHHTEKLKIYAIFTNKDLKHLHQWYKQNQMSSKQNRQANNENKTGRETRDNWQFWTKESRSESFSHEIWNGKPVWLFFLYLEKSLWLLWRHNRLRLLIKRLKSPVLHFGITSSSGELLWILFPKIWSTTCVKLFISRLDSAVTKLVPR